MGSWRRKKLSLLSLSTRRRQGSCCPPLRNGQTAGTIETSATGRTEAEAKAKAMVSPGGQPAPDPSLCFVLSRIHKETKSSH